MIKKIIGITIMVGLVGILAFGAINRTLAKSESSEIEYGGGNRGGRAVTEGLEPASDWRAAEDHEPLMESLPLTTPDAAEIEALQFMLEEEKMARDVYTAMYALWGVPVFDNIAGSEQTHMNAVLELLARYEITPEMEEQAGVFNNPDLQALYDQLVARGSQSLAEALLVGGAIEEIDILDLQESLTQTDQADIQTVFESLLRGSGNHLRAFTGNYERQTGSEYQPQYMSQEAYLAVLAETGGNGGGQGTNGRGGNGHGRQ